MLQFLKPHSKATCMHSDPKFVQPKRPLLTKIWTLPFKHPVPFIASPKKYSYDVISRNNTEIDTLTPYSSSFFYSYKETPGMERIEQMFHQMSQNNNSISNSRNNNKSPFVAQVHNANGLPITYCWSHGTTSNIWHNRKICKLQKEGHKSNATYQNNMGGSTERCKVQNK